MAEPSRIGVVGAGTMGSGIAQLGCLGGYEVVLYDPDVGALAGGVDRLESGLAKGAGRGLWTAGDAADAAGRLQKSVDLKELAGADLVIEAAPERLEVKRSLFSELERICGPDAVLATNTSSLPVSRIAEGLSAPQRVCGMHFFNPPPLMKLVEIVAGEATGEAPLATATEVARRMDRVPVRAADAPGFIVNRCNRPFALESLRMLATGFARKAEIDTAMRDAGYRMGPFELMDLIGVDVNLAVARSFYEQRAEPRWEPSPLQEELVTAGHLGRKTGRGFYTYEGGRRVEPDESSTGRDPEAIRERVIAMLVNEAAFAVEEGVAGREDVDTAMKLGLNHPRGPFEWLGELGAERIVGVLDALARSVDGDVYGVAGSLRGEI